MNRSAFKQAFLDTVPVMTGYLFLGTGFGILMSEAGYGPLWSLSMSLFIYAGSAQYLAVELLGCAAVADLHIWKRSSLLSIGGGTLVYMLLTQLVF